MEKKAKKIKEYYFNNRGLRIETDYDGFYNYICKHGKNSKILYAEWLTPNGLIITTASSIYDCDKKSVTKINRENL